MSGELHTAQTAADQASVAAVKETFRLWLISPQTTKVLSGTSSKSDLLAAYMAGVACLGRVLQQTDALQEGLAQGRAERNRILGDKS